MTTPTLTLPFLASLDDLKDEIKNIPIVEKLLSYTGEGSLVVYYIQFSNPRISDENMAEE